MKKLSSTLPNMVLSLGLITILAAALLAWSYNTTRDPIANAEANAKEQAIARVLPRYDNSPVADAVTIDAGNDSRVLTVYPATLAGLPAGAAVESYTLDGFSGEIRVLVGFDTDGAITGYQVMSHSETPGLGAKMDEWFRDGQGHRNIIDIDMDSANPLQVAKDGGSVDAITAATISSRAFLDAVNRAYDAYNIYLNSSIEQ